MPPCPFIIVCWLKSVGPKTMAKFDVDIELSADCWLILMIRDLTEKSKNKGSNERTDTGAP